MKKMYTEALLNTVCIFTCYVLSFSMRDNLVATDSIDDVLWPLESKTGVIIILLLLHGAKKTPLNSEVMFYSP